MKLVTSLVLLLVGLVLMAAVGEVAGGPRGIRRLGRRPLRPTGQRFLRQRQGRQEEIDEADLDEVAMDEAAALPNGCDPESPIGAFLLFRGVKVWCGGQGVTDFGPYGALPVEEEEE